MALSLQVFRTAHKALLGELFASVPEAIGVDESTFCGALWRSAEKSRVPEARLPQYLRGLRIGDLALAAACAAGSDSAWQTLLSTMRGPLRAAGRSMAGDRGEEMADALFGELYAARESKLGSFGGRSSLAGWLRAVLHQTWIDRLRSEKRLQQMDEDAPEPAAPAAPDPVQHSETASIARRALDQSLAALPPRQKLLLDFYYFHGLNLREAAGLVGVHEATASRELDRARGALKTQLTSILKRDYSMNETQAQECLLEAVEKGLSWRPARETQESGPSNVLLKE